jgi:hypothetical protein
VAAKQLRAARFVVDKIESAQARRLIDDHQQRR